MIHWKFEKLQGLYAVRQLEFHPHKNLLAFGSNHGELCVYDLASRTENYVGHVGKTRQDKIISLCWNKHLPEGRDDLLFTGSKLGKVCATNALADEESIVIQEYEDFPSDVFGISCNQDATKVIVSGASKTVFVYDIATGKVIKRLVDIHSMQINSCDFANQSPHLYITSSFDTSIKLWDIRAKENAPIYTITTLSQVVTTEISRRDDAILVAGLNREVSQYSFETGRLLVEHALPPAPHSSSSQLFSRAYYSASNNYVYSLMSTGKYVYVTDAQTGEWMNTIQVHFPKNAENYTNIQTMRGHPTIDEAFCILTSGPSGSQDILYAQPTMKRFTDQQLETTLPTPSAAFSSSSSNSQPHKEDVEEAMNHILTHSLQHISDCDEMIAQCSAWKQQAIHKKDELIKKELSKLEDWKESSMCIVCQTEKKSMVLIPCGHVCLCQVCCNTLTYKPSSPSSDKPDSHTCPLCSVVITQSMKVYL